MVKYFKLELKLDSFIHFIYDNLFTIIIQQK